MSVASERGGAGGLLRPERLLPISCIAGAIVLGYSEFQNMFQLSAVGNVPLCDIGAGGRHHYAQLVLALFAIFATCTAVLAGSRPAARAVAIAGVISLLLFLIIDLPHANNQGSISSTCDLAAQDATAKAVPQAGFWLELVGSLSLAVSGIALATLSPRQLHAMRPRWLVGSGTAPEDETQRPQRRWLRPAAERTQGREAPSEKKRGRSSD